VVPLADVKDLGDAGVERAEVKCALDGDSMSSAKPLALPWDLLCKPASPTVGTTVASEEFEAAVLPSDGAAGGREGSAGIGMSSSVSDPVVLFD